MGPHVDMAYREARLRRRKSRVAAARNFSCLVKLFAAFMIAIPTMLLIITAAFS